ncbi:MAG: threonine-phosphate decarboxylase [bacterium]|nr:MAG: threonine-phosphate decarboxylase [bacterium]
MRESLIIRHMIKGHGGNLHDIAKRFGVNAERMLDFSASINPFIGDVKRGKWIRDGADKIRLYPDPEYNELRAVISKHYGPPAENVLVGNGSTELLYMVPRALECKNALIVTPSYADYEDACRMAAMKIKRYYLKPANGFTLDAAEFAEKVKGCKLAVIGNPNNPTGSIIRREALLKIVDASPGTMFLIDESFMDFVRDETLLNTLRDNLVVVRSFTKFYASPGLRFGFAAARGRIIKKLVKFKEPWSVNCIAENYVIDILNGGFDTQRIIDKNNEERLYLFNKLPSVANLTTYPSAANFLLSRIGPGKWDAPKLQAALIEKGILIRDCSNFMGLDRYFFRVAVRKRRENALLIKNIKKCLSDCR